jgi:hypothetical protein
MDINVFSQYGIIKFLEMDNRKSSQDFENPAFTLAKSIQKKRSEKFKHAFDYD